MKLVTAGALNLYGAGSSTWSNMIITFAPQTKSVNTIS